MPEKDPFLLLRSNLKRHTAEKPTRVVDPPSALRFCAALAVCAASPLTTTHGQGPVQLGKGTGCALVWPRPSAGSSRIACSNGHVSRPQRPTAHAPAAAAAAALGHIYLSAQGGWVGSRQSRALQPVKPAEGGDLRGQSHAIALLGKCQKKGPFWLLLRPA